WLVGLSGLMIAIADHTAYNYGLLHNDWLYASANFFTANGYAPFMVLICAFTVGLVVDLVMENRTLPKFSEFRWPSGLEGLEGLQSLWEFTLDTRRLAFALFQHQRAALSERKQTSMVVSLLTQTLINSHTKDRRKRSAQLITKADATLSMALDPAVRMEGSADDLYDAPVDDIDLPEQYRIVAPISEGGMGIIFRGFHVHTGAKLAIKILHPTVARQAAALERFKQEAKAVGTLNHPNLVTITDFGITDNKRIPFLVMELIPGISLADSLKEAGTLPLDRFYDIFDQVCDALAHAHKRWVVHRDLKPSNILLTATDDRRDFVKIVDFGIAKLMSAADGLSTQELTRTGDLIGSPLYMSPEQGLGTYLDARSDIYSIGCVMYEALAGQPPFIGANAVQTIMKHVSEAVRPIKEVKPDADVPPALEVVILKALEKDPGNRFQTMEQLRNALHAVKDSLRPNLEQEKTLNMNEAKPLKGILNSGLFKRK
ncbi:MAG TPA: serine/threonine-protein kinase, partial [Candidatus Obscuribacterales bacterium]